MKKFEIGKTATMNGAVYEVVDRYTDKKFEPAFDYIVMIKVGAKRKNTRRIRTNKDGNEYAYWNDFSFTQNHLKFIPG